MLTVFIEGGVRDEVEPERRVPHQHPETIAEFVCTSTGSRHIRQPYTPLVFKLKSVVETTDRLRFASSAPGAKTARSAPRYAPHANCVPVNCESGLRASTVAVC